MTLIYDIILAGSIFIRYAPTSNINNEPYINNECMSIIMQCLLSCILTYHAMAAKVTNCMILLTIIRGGILYDVSILDTERNFC